MATSVLDIKTDIPDDNKVAEALGNAKCLWDEMESYILESFGNIKKEWKFYSKKAGWSLIFKNKNKTLLYFIPCKDYFKIWFVLSEKAITAAKQASLPKQVIDTICSATSYVEGTSFGVDVKDNEDLNAVILLLEIKNGA